MTLWSNRGCHDETDLLECRPAASRWSTKGRPSTPAFSRSPCPGQCQLRTLNLDGDRQADLTVHGGPNKAVYAYPSEHYPYWQRNCRARTFPGACSARTSRPKALPRTTSTRRSPAIGSSIVMVRHRGSLLQTGSQVSARRHDRAFSAQRPQRILFLGRKEGTVARATTFRIPHPK